MEQNNIALLKACNLGNLETAEKLILNGADVNYKDSLGFSPLHMVSISGHTELAKMLISSGANVNDKDMIGMTPLHIASKQGHVEVVKLLISSGANVNDKDNSGLTPLIWPIMQGKDEVVKLLLSKGATIDEMAIDIAKYGNPHIRNILKSWRSIQMGPVFKETTGIHIDPDVIKDLHEFMGEGKRRNKKSKNNKKKYKKSKKNQKNK
jgi:ankyrin repeat protein